MKEKEALEYLKEKDRELRTVENIEGILGWDEETVMPEKGEKERGEQLSLLALTAHRIKKDERLREAVFTLDGKNLSDAEGALVREWKRDITLSSIVPERLVKEMAEACSAAHGEWLEARRKSKWSLFSSSMKRLVSLNKEYAQALGDGSYNTLLDLYERGMNTETLDPLFSSLESSIHSIMDRLEGKSVPLSFLYEKYDERKEEEFCRLVARTMGFDFSRGAIGVTAHPFTTTLGSDDIRITNRFTDESVTDPIFSIVHETGHALYEQYAALNEEIRGTRLSGGASMGLHESQSRFWENIMGHSHAFWEYFYPTLQSYMPQLENIDLDSFVLALNYPHPSAIRVNADELTYTLHIILRYRIEKALFDGTLCVADIPEVWNEESKEIIRYSVKNDSEGCLQDSHWAGGSFGYFPTYALGNIYASMFYDRMCSDLGGRDNVDSALKKGDFSPITEWQNRNIWKWGAIYEPKTLMERVTGFSLDSSHFVNYLEEKFSRLYL